MRYVWILLIVCLAGCAASRPPAPAAAPPFAFALIGDMPYADADLPRFDRLQSAINGDRSLAWVLHAGDIKTGASPCTDAYLSERLALLQRFTLPLVLIPGDNEWTDCHRATAGGFQPLERLARLRALFYPTPGQSLGRPMALTTQAAEPGYAEFPEHVRWERAGVVFAALHVVGSQNGLLPFEGRTEADDAESARRMDAAIAWLHAAFERARAIDSPGVFLMIHANPGFDNRVAPPFDRFLAALEEETRAFGKPVVLAHGDSHYFRIDKPLLETGTGRRLIHFTRVETFGAADVHWLKVSVDARDANVFRIEPVLME
ncbi:MAG: hypothetical protein R2834_02320 [Rhodothermales bacterium]